MWNKQSTIELVVTTFSSGDEQGTLEPILATIIYENEQG